MLCPFKNYSGPWYYNVFGSILVGLETIFEKVFLNDSPNGYATAIIMLSFFGGLQLFCLGVIGEYVGQVYREVKARPRYIKRKRIKIKKVVSLSIEIYKRAVL